MAAAWPLGCVGPGVQRAIDARAVPLRGSMSSLGTSPGMSREGADRRGSARASSERRRAEPERPVDRAMRIEATPALEPLASRVSYALQEDAAGGRTAEGGSVVDLSELWSLAAGANPRIDQARAVLAAARADWDRARVLWLPTLRVGVRWLRHDGQIQNTSGSVIDASRSSAEAGGGARLELPLGDAAYAPAAACHEVAARSAAADAVVNQTLLDVARAYWELIRARGAEAIWAEAEEHLRQLDENAQAYLRNEKLKPADADRIRADRLAAEQERILARQDVRAASARLARLVRLDPSIELVPVEADPQPLIGSTSSLGDLAATALAQRPELLENRQWVSVACARLRQAQHGPWLPSLILDAWGGGFGGGADAFFGDFASRTDFEAAAVWQFRNLGAGDAAAARRRAAETRQAEFRVLATMDQIAQEVAEAVAQLDARTQQLEIAEQAVAAASDSYAHNRLLFREGGIELILPIEVLQAVQALARAQQNYLAALVGYNQAQFQLMWALGFPVDAPPSAPAHSGGSSDRGGAEPAARGEQP